MSCSSMWILTNVVTNTNYDDRTIPPAYYTIGETIAILNSITDSMFSISHQDFELRFLWIQSPNSIDFTNTPDIREILGLKGRTVILLAFFCGSNVIDITRNRQLIQVYSSLVRSSDLKIATADKGSGVCPGVLC